MAYTLTKGSLEDKFMAFFPPLNYRNLSVFFFFEEVVILVGMQHLLVFLNDK